MKHLLFVAVSLFSATAYSAEPVAPEDSEAVAACVACSEELKRELENCTSKSASKAQDLCRTNARGKAEECANKVGLCNLDLFMKSEPTKS